MLRTSRPSTTAGDTRLISTNGQAAPYVIDTDRNIYGNFYWVAPADLAVAATTRTATAYDRNSMGDKQAWKAAKLEADKLMKSTGKGTARLKVYGSEVVKGVRFITRANGERLIVDDLLRARSITQTS